MDWERCVVDEDDGACQKIVQTTKSALIATIEVRIGFSTRRFEPFCSYMAKVDVWLILGEHEEVR